MVKIGHDHGIQSPNEYDEAQRQIIGALACEYEIFQVDAPLRESRNVRKEFYHGT